MKIEFEILLYKWIFFNPFFFLAICLERKFNIGTITFPNLGAEAYVI